MEWCRICRRRQFQNAIKIALLATGVGRDDEVITVFNTDISSSAYADLDREG
jgi:hypothetical protein